MEMTQALQELVDIADELIEEPQAELPDVELSLVIKGV
jgi:hypothetical protein